MVERQKTDKRDFLFIYLFTYLFIYLFIYSIYLIRYLQSIKG